MRMVLRGWGVRVVAVGAGLAVLAGCSGDAEPVVTPSPTPAPTETVVESPSPTPTPSPSPTELTEEEILAAIPGSEVESLSGAFAFATTFIRESRGLFLSGDPRLFDAMSTEGCTFCANVQGDFNETNLGGLSLSGGQIKVIDDMPQGGLQSDGSWHLEFAIEIEPGTITNQEGELIEDLPAEEYVVAVALERTEASWVVIDVGSERP